MDALQIVMALLSIGAIVAAVHIFITKILPRLKDFSALVITDEKANEGILFLVLAYILIISISKVIKILMGLGNQYVSMVSVFNPGLEVFTDSIYYLAFLVMLLVSAIALSNLSVSVKRRK